MHKKYLIVDTTHEDFDSLLELATHFQNVAVPDTLLDFKYSLDGSKAKGKVLGASENWFVDGNYHLHPAILADYDDVTEFHNATNTDEWRVAPSAAEAQALMDEMFE